MGAALLLEDLDDDPETVRAPTSDVHELLDALVAGEPVHRSALTDQLDRMLAYVRETRADFDNVVLLVRRRTPTPVVHSADVHRLADGTLVLHTTLPMCARSAIAAAFDEEGTALLIGEHDDERGVPCFGASRLDLVLQARSYREALRTLDDAACFLVAPSLVETVGDPDDD